MGPGHAVDVADDNCAGAATGWVDGWEHVIGVGGIKGTTKVATTLEARNCVGRYHGVRELANASAIVGRAGASVVKGASVRHSKLTCQGTACDSNLDASGWGPSIKMRPGSWRKMGKLRWWMLASTRFCMKWTSCCMKAIVRKMLVCYDVVFQEFRYG